MNTLRKLLSQAAEHISQRDDDGAADGLVDQIEHALACFAEISLPERGEAMGGRTFTLNVADVRVMVRALRAHRADTRDGDTAVVLADALNDWLVHNG